MFTNIGSTTFLFYAGFGETLRQGALDVLKRASLASEQHIDLYDKYSFVEAQEGIDLNKIAERLVNQAMKH